MDGWMKTTHRCKILALHGKSKDHLKFSYLLVVQNTVLRQDSSCRNCVKLNSFGAT